MSTKHGRHGQGATFQKWLNFGVDLDLDADSGLLFHFSHLCRIVDFRRFLCSAHTDTVTSRLLWNVEK